MLKVSDNEIGIHFVAFGFGDFECRNSTQIIVSQEEEEQEIEKIREEILQKRGKGKKELPLTEKENQIFIEAESKSSPTCSQFESSAASIPQFSGVSLPRY